MVKKLSLVIACLLLFTATPVMAQPVDYCEGDFDNDLDQDGTDASVFKSDFGRSSFNDPCPQPECPTVQELQQQIDELKALLANVTRVGNDITFSGVNVHIVDGSGTTGDDVNGLGNLIVGYNELRGSGDDRTGSHNIVVGFNNNYSSYGGLVVGNYNAISGQYSSVNGGAVNTASGNFASVSGGRVNTASGDFASVSGGIGNTASGIDSASVSGGNNNTASGNYSSVSGGGSNIASGDYANVSGGFNRSAAGGDDWAAGGLWQDY